MQVNYLKLIIDILLNDDKDKGKTQGNFLVLPIVFGVAQIFFDSRHGPNVLPSGQILTLPNRRVKTLIILNEGNATIHYEANVLQNEFKLGSILRAQEDVQLESRKFSKDFYSLFIQAVAPDGPNYQNNIGVGSTNGPNWNGDLTTESY